MKKASLIIIASLLMVGLAFAGQSRIRSTGTSVQDYQGYDFLQADIFGLQIANGGSVNFNLDNIAGFNQVNFYIAATSSGNITTANLQAKLMNGDSIGTAQTLTSGTDVTNFKSGQYVMTIYNPVATTINITGNILVTK